MRALTRFLRTTIAVLLPVTLLVLCVAPFSKAHGQPLPLNPADAIQPPFPEWPSLSAEAESAMHHISEGQNIPLARLVVVNEHKREYPNQGRSFRAFTLLDKDSGRFFNLLVDSVDGSVVEDVAAIERTENDARRARYGQP